MRVVHTLDVPAGQRFDYWKDALTDTFVPLEVRCPGDGAGFRGRLSGADLGSLRFIEVAAEPHTALRTARLVRSAPSGCYKVGLQLRGTSVLIQDGRQATLSPGDLALYDTDRPYTLAFSDPHRMLVLVFPRDMLGMPAGRLAGLTATRLRGGTAALVGPFLGQLSDLLDEVGGQAGVRLAGNVLDLLGTVLAERLDCFPRDPDSAHRALMLRITAFIETRLGDASLSPADIAAAHHVSLRQLHKLFQASGSTVAGWIRQRRLEHCAHDLRADGPVAVSVVGARWGYPDPAHFSRLFKAAYGTSPRDYRYLSGQASCAGIQDGPGRPPRVLAAWIVCAERPPSSPAARAASGWRRRGRSSPRGRGCAWPGWCRTRCATAPPRSGRPRPGWWPT